MRNVYLYKPKNLINVNDAFFNSYAIPIIKDKELGEIYRNAIIKVEDVQFKGTDRIISKFNDYDLNLSGLSTGCKTVINVMLSSHYVYENEKYSYYIEKKGNIVINILECGMNYIKYIYKLKDGNIYMPQFRFMDRNININTQVSVHVDKKNSISFSNTDDMERWYIENV